MTQTSIFPTGDGSDDEATVWSGETIEASDKTVTSESFSGIITLGRCFAILHREKNTQVRGHLSTDNVVLAVSGQ